jgi:uncharacterized protein YndB with AHSA1/START domain
MSPMTTGDDPRNGTWTRTTRVIRARPEALYQAFVDPASLVEWLPPGGMTGAIHAFAAGEGGGYSMSLHYPPGERAYRGKTAEREDRVHVRFLSLVPPRRIVESVRFETTDPGLQSEMMLTVTLDPVAAGTEVTLLFERLPRGLRPEDNDAGARLSLAQLARQFE